MSNPHFIYRIHYSLERKIKRNRYIPFIDLINNISNNNTNNNTNINNIVFLKNSRGETLLHTAVKFKRTNIIQYLLNNFNNLKIYKNYRGETPFFHACKSGYMFIVRLFLNCQDFMSFINIKDNSLYSPLLKSYKNGHFPIANLLLEKGADWNIMSNDGYVIPQSFVYNFINRNNRRFHNLSLSPISSPSPTPSTPSPSSPPTPYPIHRPYTSISMSPLIDDYLSLPNIISVAADSATEQFTFGSFNTFDINFLSEERLDEPKLKVIKPNIEIINAIKELYINKKEMCPITYEPLKIETTSITSCYHLFNKDAIENWFKTKNTCPVCREKCEIW